jgi:hypothetical protein
MDSPHCKNLKVRPCTKLEKEKLCTVYTRDDKKKCRKYRKARELTEANVIRSRPLKILQKSIPEPEPIKELTTLEKVQAVWGGEESVQIAQDIDGLERYPVRSIKGLIDNETLRKELEKEITTLSGDMDIHLDRYERMTTTEFVNLTSVLLNIDGVELKKKILDNIDKGVYILYEEMENAVLKALELRKNNSSTVYVTSKNVMSSEFIKEAGIDSFGSILNNFKNFSVLGKTSSSDSIVFNARFEPSKSVNSLRELNIPVTPLYFKIYPTKVSTGSVRRLIENPGLEFEQSAYNKLFKLVQKNVTPNILCTAATSSNISGFGDFLESDKLSGAAKKELTEQSKKINGGKWIETGVIITQPGGKTVYQLFVGLDAEEKRSVLFQLMYTLYVFEKIQFSHGDLHISNIFIIDVPNMELCYVIEGQQYRFNTRKLVKIYDFDHGTICKTTTIRVNRDSNFTIMGELNETRDIHNNLNTKYAETNIFNKNLDLLIFTNYLSYIYPRFFDHFTISNSDSEVNDFFRECFPGFDSVNPLSQVKIRDTYLTLLENESNRKEANRIFGLKANTGEEYTKYNVNNDVLNMTWMNYFRAIKDNFSRIVKSFKFEDESVPNNHLWIPDVVVLPRNMILANRYFNSFKSVEPIDIRKMPVYTIDNRIM